MREVQQYLINTDQLAIRYDVAWGDNHYHVECKPFPNPGWPDELIPSQYFERQRMLVRSAFESIERHHGFKRRDQHALPLPTGVNIARYV